MSQVKVQQPVIHIPIIKKWGVQNSYVTQVLKKLGLEPLYAGVHKMYYYTNEEGCIALLPNLLLKSELYKPSKFTCINYAYKVWNECSQRFDINTWVPVIGRIPSSSTARHAWNLIMMGDEKGLDFDKFLYFEPNDGWEFSAELEMAGQAFPIGAEGYTGEFIFY